MNELLYKPARLVAPTGKMLLPNIHAGDPQLRAKFEVAVRIYDEIVHRVIAYMNELDPMIEDIVGNEFLRNYDDQFRHLYFIMNEVNKYFITRFPPPARGPRPVPRQASRMNRVHL